MAPCYHRSSNQPTTNWPAIRSPNGRAGNRTQQTLYSRLDVTTTLRGWLDSHHYIRCVRRVYHSPLIDASGWRQTGKETSRVKVRYKMCLAPFLGESALSRDKGARGDAIAPDRKRLPVVCRLGSRRYPRGSPVVHSSVVGDGSVHRLCHRRICTASACARRPGCPDSRCPASAWESPALGPLAERQPWAGPLRRPRSGAEPGAAESAHQTQWQ